MQSVLDIQTVILLSVNGFDKFLGKSSAHEQSFFATETIKKDSLLNILRSKFTANYLSLKSVNISLPLLFDRISGKELWQ